MRISGIIDYFLKNIDLVDARDLGTNEIIECYSRLVDFTPCNETEDDPDVVGRDPGDLCGIVLPHCFG